MQKYWASQNDKQYPPPPNENTRTRTHTLYNTDRPMRAEFKSYLGYQFPKEIYDSSNPLEPVLSTGKK